MSYLTVNGVRLYVEVEGSGPALLLLHGFTGSAETWRPHRAAWEGFTAVAVDLLGHGRSDCPADPARYAVERCVEDLLAVLDRLGFPRAAVLGYSMGGRVALRLALRAPERVPALVLESASPGIPDPTERAERARSDDALADGIERDGVEAFVDRWEALPLWASQARLPEEVRARLRAQRLRNSAAGLAGSLRGMGAGREEPVLDRLGALPMPVLLLAGELDEKYCRLAREMAGRLPRPQVVTVPEAGHAVHLEQPARFQAAVRAFLLDTLRPAGRPGAEETLRHSSER
ncbi:MAG TPA: 2-succinyl-6-hydroxy-2,4-cyclohexadiene-1-carboxylate synthase [Dehalococcoidia bacterium]